MSTTQFDFLRSFAQGSVLVVLVGVGRSAWAQTQACSYEITTTAAPIAVANVPSLSMLGVALLAAAIGVVAWRMRWFPGARFMAAMLVAAAAMLANEGGSGLVQKAYAQAAEILLTVATGETISGTQANDGSTLNFRNASGRPLRISSINPSPGTCAVGSVIPVDGLCSTVSSCPVVCENGFEQVDGVCVQPSCGFNEVWAPVPGTEPQVYECMCREGYERNQAGRCVRAG